MNIQTFFKFTFLTVATLNLIGCAFLHHAQLGEIDSTVVSKGRKFEILLSETGVNLQEAAAIGAAITRHQKTSEAIGNVGAIIGLFQMGPRTGNPVYDDKYADKLFDLLQKECRGTVTGLMSIRETAKYPVVSGEIVKIVGYCLES